MKRLFAVAAAMLLLSTWVTSAPAQAAPRGEAGYRVDTMVFPPSDDAKLCVIPPVVPSEPGGVVRVKAVEPGVTTSDQMSDPYGFFNLVFVKPNVFVQITDPDNKGREAFQDAPAIVFDLSNNDEVTTADLKKIGALKEWLGALQHEFSCLSCQLDAIESRPGSPGLLVAGGAAKVKAAVSAQLAAFATNRLSRALARLAGAIESQPVKLPHMGPRFTELKRERLRRALQNAVSNDDDTDPAKASLRTKLETVEASGVFPLGASEQIYAAMAQAVPCPLDDSLFWAYRLDLQSKDANIDLTEGMRIRVENAAFSEQINPDTHGYGGYVASSTAFYSIVRNLKPTGPEPKFALEFDAFPAELRFSDKLPLLASPKPPSLVGVVNAAGLIDLGVRNFDRRYLRLYVPSEEVLDATNPKDLEGRNESYVLSADSYKDLIVRDNSTTEDGCAAHKVPQGAIHRDNSTTENPPKSKDYQPYRTIFRGRASIVPEIQITFQGMSRWVSVGTTLSQLFKAEGIDLVTAGLDSVKLERRFQNQSRSVEFSALSEDADNLRVVKGDCITWQH